MLIIIYIDYNDSSLSIHSHSKSIDTTASNLEHPRSVYPITTHLNPSVASYIHKRSLCNCASCIPPQAFLLACIQICCLCKGFNHFGDIVQQNTITPNFSTIEVVYSMGSEIPQPVIMLCDPAGYQYGCCTKK